MARAVPMIEVESLCKGWPDGNPALNGVSFSIAAGETLGLVGESGAGKTTLARILAGLIPARSYRGEVRIGGRRIQEWPRRRRPLQMIFQDPRAALNPHMTVARLLEEPFRIRHIPPPAYQERLVWLTRMLGLDMLSPRSLPRELSGGECQRLALARALALAPQALVADEATAQLDPLAAARVVEGVLNWQQQEQGTCLWISHDLTLLRRVAQRVAVLYQGGLVEMGPTARVLERPVHPYSRWLGGIEEDSAIVSGRRPDQAADAGCRYRGRCPRATAQCLEVPPWRSWADRHWVACHHPVD